MTNRDALHDALSQAVDWIEECGSDYQGRQFVLTESRAALSGLSVVKTDNPTHELIDRLLTYADNCKADGMVQAESDLRAACDCIIGSMSAIDILKRRFREAS